MSITFLIFCTLTFQICLATSLKAGETIEQLFQKKQYREIIALENKVDSFTPKEVYFLGRSFFHLKNPQKAIGYYAKAIGSGMDSAYVHYQKSLAHRSIKQFKEAYKEIEIAKSMKPEEGDYTIELGFAFYNLEMPDSALKIFSEAQVRFPKHYSSYYMVPHIYHRYGMNKKALTDFYKACTIIPATHTLYEQALIDIGNIEYSINKNYPEAIKAFKEVISINPDNYNQYYQLIKAYNSSGDHETADSLFLVLKKAFENKKLGSNENKYKNVPIYETEWKGNIITVYKSFIEPVETLDVFYRIYVLDSSGTDIVRNFMIEKTENNPQGAKFFLCEKDTEKGKHITYPYGWNSDTFTLKEIIAAVITVLQGPDQRK